MLDRRTFLGSVTLAAAAVANRKTWAAERDCPWRVGLARALITPNEPMPMVGYGPRVSEGVHDDLYAKAMAIETGGLRAVLITADLLFFRAPVAEAIARRIIEQTDLVRSQILLTASHTHSGPVVGMTADLESFSVPQELHPRVAAYTRWLESQIVEMAVKALSEMKPARVSWNAGQADFVMNRRKKTSGGVEMAPNPDGPVDRSVPVLRVDDARGSLQAVVFGCACHPVTLTGENRLLSGDYAGLAQQAIERRHPGVQAMFVPGCAGDANSHPRGSADLACKQGETLAAEIDRVVAGKMEPLSGPLRVDLAWTALPLEHRFPHARWQEIASGPSWWHARTAKAMLERLDRGEQLPQNYSAPIALWQFGAGLSLVGLPGEAVADYARKIGERLGPRNVWVAAYCNESFGYLPSSQILHEGGHESMGLTLDVGLFAPEVEQTVLTRVEALSGGILRGDHCPEQRWQVISPEEAGLDPHKLEQVVAQARIGPGSFGGVPVGENDWGAVLARDGYLVRRWGNPAFKCQSASLGKCIMRALFGLSVEAGVIKPDEPIGKTWTGRGELSHAHKYLDEGLHRQLTWRQLLEHQGGFVLESGFHWRKKTLFHAVIPQGVAWTGDPLFDNFAQTPPGATTRYSSAGYWRLGQALTAAWNSDLKEVLDRHLFRHLGIPADRWQWVPGKLVHDTRDFYPEFPGYGEYVDPPYEIKGHVVRGGAGWMKISPEDLARFGQLIATQGRWERRRLLGQEWLRGHAGLDIHVVGGDPETLVVIAKINTSGFPWGAEVGTRGTFAFPKELILGPVRRKGG